MFSGTQSIWESLFPKCFAKWYRAPSPSGISRVISSTEREFRFALCKRSLAARRGLEKRRGSFLFPLKVTKTFSACFKISSRTSFWGWVKSQKPSMKTTLSRKKGYSFKMFASLSPSSMGSEKREFTAALNEALKRAVWESFSFSSGSGRSCFSKSEMALGVSPAICKAERSSFKALTKSASSFKFKVVKLGFNR